MMHAAAKALLVAEALCVLQLARAARRTADADLGIARDAASVRAFGDKFEVSGDAYVDNDVVVLTNGGYSQFGAATWKEAFDNEGEIKAKFTYSMFGFGNGADGVCVALLDAANEDHMSPGIAGGGLGFNERPGAVLGVGFDMHGNFGAGPHRVVVKAGEWGDFKVIDAFPFKVERQHVKVKLRFSLEAEDKYPSLDIDISWKSRILLLVKRKRKKSFHVPSGKLKGLVFPPWMKVSFTASTGSLTNWHVVEDLKVKEEAED